MSYSDSDIAIMLDNVDQEKFPENFTAISNEYNRRKVRNLNLYILKLSQEDFETYINKLQLIELKNHLNILDTIECSKHIEYINQRIAKIESTDSHSNENVDPQGATDPAIELLNPCDQDLDIPTVENIYTFDIESINFPGIAKTWQQKVKRNSLNIFFAFAISPLIFAIEIHGKESAELLVKVLLLAAITFYIYSKATEPSIEKNARFLSLSVNYSPAGSSGYSRTTTCMQFMSEGETYEYYGSNSQLLPTDVDFVIELNSKNIIVGYDIQNNSNNND